MKILIVKDEEPVLKDIEFYLRIRYPEAAVLTAIKEYEVIKVIEAENPDLVILTAPAQNNNHCDLVCQIRLISTVPLLVMTDGHDVENAMVLEAGADDYITKPPNPVELLARINALLRRTHGFGLNHNRKLCIGSLVIDVDRHDVSVSGKMVKLTPIEHTLLVELAKNEGQVLPHRVLLEKVWGSGYVGDHAFIKKYIYRLRCKLEPDPHNPRMFLYERGIGYRFMRPG